MSGNRRHAGGLASAYTNLRRQWFFDAERSGKFAPILKVFSDFAKRDRNVLGVAEQVDSEGLLICELRARRQMLEKLFEEFP